MQCTICYARSAETRVRAVPRNLKYQHVNKEGRYEGTRYGPNVHEVK
jgi:hypothetical protein